MIKLTGNRVAVTPILDPDKSSGGIWIPDVAKERSDQGIVKYVGPDVKNLKPGDYILFSGYTGTVVNFGDVEGVLIFFREEFAVCKLGNVNTAIPGLYFRERFDPRILKDQIRNLFQKHGHTWYESCYSELMSIIEMNNPYFEATYEVAANIIADSWRNTDFAKSVALYQPGEPGRKKIAANPDFSHTEIAEIEERENESD